MKNPKRILIIRQHDQLGDFIISTPAVRAVRERFPQAHLSLMCRTFTLEAARCNPHVDRVIEFRDNLRDWNPVYALRFAGAVAGLPGFPRYDLVVVLNTVSRSSTSDHLASLTRAPWILGPESPKPRKPAGQGEGVYNLVSPVKPPPRHMAEVNLDVVRQLGADTLDLSYDLEVPPHAAAQAEKELSRLPGPVVGIHFGTLDPVKRYPLNRFALIADYVAKRHGGTAVVLPAPGEDRALQDFLAAAGTNPKVLALSGLTALAARLAACRVVVCNDSGILHMAAAVGTSTVSFHSRGHPDVWKPWGENHIALYAGPDLIENIPVAQAKQALDSLLAEPEPVDQS